ncbi:MAG: bifunctional 5,10-methylenetetrahydrofolate dehydrogenase/5,10-methenyltetrahydrofolate cyclohydrolase [Minisyncoccia bacterium]
MIVDGRAIAEGVYLHLREEGKVGLTLGILVGEKNPVIDSFVRIKEKAAERLEVELIREELNVGATTADAVAAVRMLAAKTNGIIVQLPLPSRIDVEKVLAAIPPEKDVDGISSAPKVRPPVAEAVKEILEFAGVDVNGKNAVVVGSGRLVGRPCASLLKELGASVTILGKADSLDALKNADIVILGAGEPGLVKPEHLKQGVVLIDAGTSESSGKIAGDADPTCAEVASIFTPVPGGVGPIAVAMIFKNLFDLAK